MNQVFSKIWIIIITILVLVCVGGQIFLYKSQQKILKEVMTLREIIGIKESLALRPLDEILREEKIRKEIREEERIKRLEEARKAGNQLNVPKTVGDWTLTVTNIRRIENAIVAPHLRHTITDKDAIIVDLLFVAGHGCKVKCRISNLINDFKLQTLDGMIMQKGEYSTAFYATPSLNRRHTGTHSLQPGDKGERQAYFFADPEDNDFIFSYYNRRSGETQFYRLKL